MTLPAPRQRGDTNRASRPGTAWHATPEGLFVARERRVQALKRTRDHLALAVDIATQTLPALDLLNEIFSRSCIGK